jgi:hypothetical protein
MSSVIRDLNFVKWKLAGRPQRADTANVMIRPRSWDVDPKGNSNLRDAAVRLEIAYETFDADPAAIQDNIVLAMGALVQCLDLAARVERRARRHGDRHRSSHRVHDRGIRRPDVVGLHRHSHHSKNAGAMSR